MEKLALLLFIPFFVDALLYFKARFINHAGDVQAFGKPNKDGTIDLPYHKLYDSAHIAIWLQKKLLGKATEEGVTKIILFAEAILAILCVILLI